MIGKRLKHYEIVSEIGRGGMGEVYVARDTRLDREVALKVLPGELAADPERLARFEREAKTLAAISHPNIVTIYSVEEADGVRFLTMELVRGTTLDEKVPASGMAMRNFLELAEPLADAVAAAHDQGIHHRDLKPANVMVTDDGRVKVLDFGLAKFKRGPAPTAEDATQMLTGGFSDDMTAEGKIVGTISYMSPEQAQGASIDHRSDIFSLGILLYEMVTGQRPFDGPNNISVLSSILKDEPRSISDVRENDDVPLPLARIIHRALAKRPDQRYQSARDLKQDLADLKTDLASGELRASGLHSGTHAAAGENAGLRRTGLRVAGLVVTVVAAVGLLWYGFSSGGGEGSGTGVAPIASRSEVPSVAVLPFDNLTGDAELDWLRHGLPEMLVTDLSQAQGLRVVGNDRIHTILERAGQDSQGDMAAADIQAIGREANVGMLILGTFVRAGDEIRIDARVQDPSTSEVLASERVAGSPDAIFDLVDQLSSRIRDRVGMQGLSAQMMADMSEEGMGDRDLVAMTTGSVEAYRLFAEGNRRLQESRAAEAAPLYERAVELDPDFGMAWAKLSVAYGNDDKPDEARAAATRAFELSEGMPLEEQLYVRGRYHSLDAETWDEAVAAYAKARELFPNNTAVRNNLGLLYMNRGELDLAAETLEEAISLGTSFAGAYGNLAQAYGQAGRNHDAVRVLSRRIEQAPGDADARASLARYLTAVGQLDRARTELETAVAIDGSVRPLLMALQAVDQEWGAVEANLAALETAGETATLYQVRASLALMRGRIEEGRRVIEEGIAFSANRPFVQANAFQEAFDLAVRLREPDTLEALADRMEAAGIPTGPDQMIPVARMLADAMRGDRQAAEAHAAQLLRMVQAIAVSEEIRARVNAQIDGSLAWAAGNSEAAARELARAHDLAAPSVLRTDRLDMAFQLGEVLWESGQHQEAVPYFEEVDAAVIQKVEMPIAAVRIEWFLGKAAEERGDRQQALGRYRRFLGFWEDGEIDRDRVAEARRYVDANG